MAAHEGLDIAAVLVLHLVADTRAARIRRDGPDTDIDTDTDTDDLTATPTVTVTATAAATPTSNVAVTSATSGNSTSSTEAGSSSGSHLDQGVKAGVAIGAIVAGFFIAGAIFMIVRRWLRNRRARGMGSCGPNNPQSIAARNIDSSGGTGGTGGDYRPVEKSSHISNITTSSTGGGARPWFDTGPGSTELEAGHNQGSMGVPSWVWEKTELPAPRHELEMADSSRHGVRTAELPDARGSLFEPVELPAVVPLMPRDRNEDVVDRLGIAGTWSHGSERTWTTGSTSPHNAGTVVSSPTGTTVTEEGMVSPCSTGSRNNQARK